MITLSSTYNNLALVKMVSAVLLLLQFMMTTMMIMTTTTMLSKMEDGDRRGVSQSELILCHAPNNPSNDSNPCEFIHPSIHPVCITSTSASPLCRSSRPASQPANEPASHLSLPAPRSRLAAVADWLGWPWRGGRRRERRSQTPS